MSVEVETRESFYTEDENDLFVQATNMYDEFENLGGKKEVKKKGETNMLACHHTVRGGDAIWSKCVAEVKADIPTVLLLMHEIARGDVTVKTDAESRIVETLSEHSELRIENIRRRYKSRIVPISILSIVTWQYMEDGSYFQVEVPKHEYQCQEHHYKRVRKALRIFPGKSSSTSCLVVMVCVVSVVTNVAERFLKRIGELPLTLQAQIQMRRRLKDYDEDDGNMLAMELKRRSLWKYRRKESVSLDGTVEKMIRDHHGLGELSKQHSWLSKFLVEIVKADLRLNTSIPCRLEDFTGKDAVSAARNLINALRVRKKPESGLLLWKREFPAMTEWMNANPWLEAFLVQMSTNIVALAPWGLKIRLLFGASLSTIDLITDVVMIFTYSSTGQGAYAHALGAMVLSCLLLQSLVVYANNAKKMHVVAKELLWVFLGLKPALDASRVATGQKMDAHHIFEPLEEMTFTKASELFSEAIPGSVLQMYAILESAQQGRPIGTNAICSVLISFITSGFIAAVISYDFDMDPQKRMDTPSFYGFIQNNAIQRSVAFVQLMLISISQLISRCSAAALLVLVEPLYFVVFVAIDYTAFFAIKIATGDYTYWIPLDGLTCTIISFIVRLMSKSISDYTSIIQMRHPNEMGGLYWTCSGVIGIAALIFSVAVFERSEKSDTNLLHDETLWTMAISLALIWLLSFSLLLLRMEKKYRLTFFSCQTGCSINQAYFTNGRNDEEKAIVLTINPLKWKHAIGQKVEDWVRQSYPRWQKERPSWLTDTLRAKIPIEFLPGGREKEAERWRRLYVGGQKEFGMRKISHIIPLRTDVS